MQARHVSYGDIDGAGEEITVGIVDTIFEANESQTGNVSQSVCCLREYADDPPDRTAQHGEWVFDIASCYAYEATFALYLAAFDMADADDESDVRIPQLALARAVDAAIEHDVDVLNVSAGRSRPNCTHGNCVYCSEVDRAVDHGISVVASAGNQQDEAVHCPSNTESAISVGGMEVECTYSPPRIPGTRSGKPPQAYWTYLFDGNDYPDGAATATYCSTRGCWQNGGGCENNKLRTSWDQNPIFSGGKPDVLAPVHYAGEQEAGRPFVWAASSFAAPVVSGCIAGVLSELDWEPSPFGIRQAIRDGAEPLGEIRVDGFDAAGTYRELSE